MGDAPRATLSVTIILSFMKKSILLVLASQACFACQLLAGSTPVGKGISPPPLPEAPGIEWEISAGYDTHYIFRGELLQENTPWAQISLDVPITESLSWNLTPWFLYDADSDYSEFDLNSSFSLSVGKTEFSVGYASYYYPRGGEGDGFGLGDEQEFSLGVSRDIFSLKASATAVYNIRRDGFYFEAALAQPYEFNDTVSVELGVALGFDTGYYAKGFDFNHALVTLSVPINLTESLVLTPYIAGNFPGGNLDEEDAHVFGGVKLAFSF